MQKAIFYTLLIVITLGFVFYGVKKNSSDFRMSWHRDNSIEEESDRKNLLINEVFDSFSEIEVDAAVMELVIEEGSAFKVEGPYNREYLKPEITVNNGVLKVFQKGKKRTVNAGSHKCRVVITIPSGTSLNAVYVNSNVGDVKVREIEAKSINIEVDVGEIDVRRAAFETIECETNVGEITIDPQDAFDDYDISASTDVGEVRIDGRSYKRSYNQRTNSSKKITAKANVGQINIK